MGGSVGTLSNQQGVVELRYYTNVPSDKYTLPKDDLRKA